jgi:hypothetical protein
MHLIDISYTDFAKISLPSNYVCKRNLAFMLIISRIISLDIKLVVSSLLAANFGIQLKRLKNG